MSGWRALGTVCGALGVAFVLDVAVCLLPENDYQRWQLVNGTVFEQLRSAYERIHFDPRPIDVAIVGPSKTMLGLSPERIEQQLSGQGKTVQVANLSVVATGRNVEWAIVDELFKSKAPKLIVIGVDDSPHPYGHPGFKYVAPAGAIVFPPQPLLHDYLYDMAYLPARKVKLFGAWMFPGLFDLNKQFDLDNYSRARMDFTSGTLYLEDQTIDMEREVSREALLAQSRSRDPAPPSLASRALGLFNEGDDHTYIREIAREARAHDARLLFVFLPTFNGSQEIKDRAFLEQYGPVLNNGDLTQRHGLFENWLHLNHAGALVMSDRLANAIAGLNL
jgi:hypothetical protein